MVTIENPTWAERVLAVRLLLDITQIELSERLNTSQAAVSRWEKQTSRPYSAAAERFLELERETVGGEIVVEQRWGLEP